MEVPYYEARRVEIHFEDWSKVPRVFVDGPTSPHRYKRDGEEWLCMWYPHDPVDEKWMFSDGLLALLNHIQAHLFREAWWRETGEWLGPEAPHGPGQKARDDEEVGDGERHHRELALSRS
jgi:hypothetical protein